MSRQQNRRRRTRDMVVRKVRIKERRADTIKSGDILWSDESGRIFVLEVVEVEVDARGNLLAAADDAPASWAESADDEPKVKALAFVTRRQTDGHVQTLGAYAHRTMLKTVSRDH